MSHDYEDELPAKKGWWSRNWMWAAPLGCLTPLVLCCGLVTVIISTAFSALKSADVYKQALTRAQEDPAVKEALGTPVTDGWMLNGQINIKNDTGRADLVIPLSGPKGTGDLILAADLAGGVWTYTTLEVAVSNGPRINLLAKADPKKNVDQKDDANNDDKKKAKR